MPHFLSPAGLAMTKEAEGLRLEAYLCPAGKLTIGYGHTGPDVVPGQCITQSKADDILLADMTTAAVAVDRSVTVPLSENQRYALADFAFNLGAGALMGSTLLKRLNAGDYQGAADEFLKWDKAHVDGELVVLPGLSARRARERAMFLAADGTEV